MFKQPPYKTSTGNWYTVALFYEPSIGFKSKDQIEDFKPIFTLYDARPGLISGRDAFVELGDPTGYKWAIRYLGSWAHWNRLLKAPWFREALSVWQEELNAKLKSEAMDVIRLIASEGQPAQALAAAKFLALKEYDKPTAGRPSAETLKGELKNAVQALSVEEEDSARIGLKLASVNGNRT